MALRISLEIGHEASIRTKKTQEGFTHDWEVFVRGCEGAEIHHYVEKVVFYLHETFPKPKRVVKEPPYSLKESGYAGFNLPIDVYLRNSGEPKKISFTYDLHLQTAGPALLKVQKEKYVFSSPSEDFKLKLLKGGATISNSLSVQEVSDSRSSLDDKNQMTSKPKLGGCDALKRQKFKPEEPFKNFQELFGSPIITTSKTTSDQKQQVWKESKSASKSDKGADKVRTKHSPHKEGHKDKDKSKDSEKKSSKDEKKKDKMRERSKDKGVKKEKSPRPKSPSPRRSPKRPSSPPRLSSPPVVKHKEPKQHDKEKRDKSEDKKAKKEKRKEHKENKHAEEQKPEEHKEAKARIESSKKDAAKAKNESPPSPSPQRPAEKKDKSKEKASSKESSKGDRSYSEKYKSKKKDKEKRDKKEEKPYKSEKKAEKAAEAKPGLFAKNEPQPPPPQQQQQQPKKEKSYLNAPIPIVDDDDSNSSVSSSASSATERSVDKGKPKSEAVQAKEDKNQKLKKEKGYQESAIKCKRKSNSAEVEETSEKVPRLHVLNNNSDADQEVAGTDVHDEEEDYFNLLRNLQHKIMTLKDNSELQKVVQLIAETGRYEVSAHTFDFDLCLLERSTVQQLQEFFASET